MGFLCVGGKVNHFYPDQLELTLTLPRSLCKPLVDMQIANPYIAQVDRLPAAEPLPHG